ncbi:MAG: hypothetical protein RL213_1111 [Bacteroidota bacterium]
MSRYSDQELRYGLRNGSREILFYLGSRYFQTSRRWLRSKGFRDADTPSIFAEAVVRMLRELQQKQLPGHLEVREFLANVLRNYVRDLKRTAAADPATEATEERIEAAARCFSILDEDRRRLLSGRYADRLNFEQLAERIGFGNAVIAEAELYKALDNLEHILQARLLEYGSPLSVFSTEDCRSADRFIDGTLTGSERSAFEIRLSDDEGLRKRMTLREWTVAGVRQAADEELAGEIVKSLGYRKSLMPFGLKMILGFAAVLTVVVLGWSYLGSEKAGDRPVLSFRWLNKVGSIIRLTKENPKRPAADSSAVRDTSSEQLAETPEMDSLVSFEEGRSVDSALVTETSAEVEEEIVVRKDQLLVSMEMTPRSVARTGDPKPASMAESAARKLNPGAGLVDDEHPAGKMDVEFWLSPVRYRGYRLNGNLLQLYGIDLPDAVRLFQVDKKLFLRNGEELYELSPSGDFQSYSPSKDPEIASLCK